MTGKIPDCPDCETDVFVQRRKGTAKLDWQCNWCGVVWCQTKYGSRWGKPTNVQDGRA